MTIGPIVSRMILRLFLSYCRKLHETLFIPVLSKNAPHMIAFIVVTKLARLIVFTFEEFGTFDRNDKVSRDGNTEYSRRDAPEEDRSQDAASSKGLDQR